MRKPHGQKVLRRLDVAKLKLSTVQQNFVTPLEHQLSMAESNDWESMKKAIYFSASQVLVQPLENIKTGLIKMILKLKLYWKRNASFTERTRMIRVLMRRKMPISISAEMFKKSSKLTKCVARLKN